MPVAGDQPLSFIAEVDRSLYLAKQGGRNRIVAVDRTAVSKVSLSQA
jgi:PleD family two-component response regulator